MTKYERAEELYTSGKSLKSIARRFHTNHTSVRNWLLKLGVTMRPRGRPATVKTSARRRRVAKVL
jgi:transposase-like protein